MGTFSKERRSFKDRSTDQACFGGVVFLLGEVLDGKKGTEITPATKRMKGRRGRHSRKKQRRILHET